MTDSTGRTKKLLKSAAALIFWIALWYIAALISGQELILPSPLSVIKTLAELCTEAEFWLSAASSLLRVFLGFILGVIVGTVIAALTSSSSVCDTLFSPMLRVVRATPVASFIILALLWIGRALVPVFISMLMVIPVVSSAVTTAAKSVDSDILEMSRAYSFGRAKTLRLIYIPSIYPSWRSAAITSMGLAWKSGVAAEVLCLPRLSVGTELYYSKIYLETPSLFAYTAVVIILSFILERIFIAFTKRRGRNDKV